MPGQQSASRHASALWACKLLAGGAGAAGRLRGTDLCFAGDAFGHLDRGDIFIGSLAGQVGVWAWAQRVTARAIRA